LLLARGADINAQNENGKTALMAAAMWGYPEVAKLLVENGADISLQDDLGRTAVHLALSAQHPEVAELIKQTYRRIKRPHGKFITAKLKRILHK